MFDPQALGAFTEMLFKPYVSRINFEYFFPSAPSQLEVWRSRGEVSESCRVREAGTRLKIG